MPSALVLDTPEQQLTALVRTRADLSGGDVPLWWVGDVYANAPGEPYQHLFGFEGVNVARITAIDGGYEMLSREIGFYLDPRTREILDSWTNPFTGETVEVGHVTNDPVNQRWLLNSPRGPFRIPMTLLGDRVCFNMDIPLAYPSVLPVAEFPENSADDTYRALELFQFFADTDALARDDSSSVPCDFSWSRLSPWLPWMRMGQRPGGLVFHTRGRKLESFAQMPDRVGGHITSHYPEYASAPAEWSEPNETSWTWFRRHQQETS